MNVVVLTIGNEILTGNTKNSNFEWIGQHLTEIGCNVTSQWTVADIHDSIILSLTDLLHQKPDMFIVTGGLGPTEDDVTRKALFQFVGTDAEFDEDYWKELQARFTKFGINIPESNRNQALIPKKGDVIPNPVGSARGYKFEIDGSILIALPGVPVEMETMMTKSVIPLIKDMEITPTTIKTIRTTGIPESALIETLEPVLKKKHQCTLGFYPSIYGVDIRFSHQEPKLVLVLASQLTGILGDVIYGNDKERMEYVVVHLAKEKSKTIATAESCTGGLISHRLTEVPGSSSVYLGGMVVYSNDAKINLLEVENSIIQKHGAVSEETAAAMAVNVRKIFGADYGISITGIAGPTGGSPEKPVGLVYIGLANGKDVAVNKFRFGKNRKRNKLRVSQAGLNWLRKSLIND